MRGPRPRFGYATESTLLLTNMTGCLLVSEDMNDTEELVVPEQVIQTLASQNPACQYNDMYYPDYYLINSLKYDMWFTAMIIPF